MTEPTKRASWAIVLAACILAGAVALTGLALRGSIYRHAAEVAQLREAVLAFQPSAGARGRPAADPGARHDVALEGAPSRGENSAKVTIVEFSDFQCPYCSKANGTLEQIETQYGDDVRLVFKHMPLPTHPQAEGAHEAAEAAHRQGRFWDMHDRIFAQQGDLSPEHLRQHASDLGLDLVRYDEDLSSASVQDRITEDKAEALGIGIRGTPAFLINGRLLSGAQPFSRFEALIDEELAQN
jgi:protein-disulfide isomerase